MFRTETIKGKKPLHLAIFPTGCKLWSRRNKKDFQEVYAEQLEKIKDIVKLQIKNEIPVLTIHLMKYYENEPLHHSILVDEIISFLDSLGMEKFIMDEQVKVTVLGRWYDLPSRAIDSIKSILNKTKDFDRFFLNLCINYDGQLEILDACKLMMRKSQMKRLEPDYVEKGTIRENIYSSNFPPPDIILKLGEKNKLSSFLLWDCGNAYIYFAKTLWPKLDTKLILKVIENWQKSLIQEYS